MKIFLVMAYGECRKNPRWDSDWESPVFASKNEETAKKHIEELKKKDAKFNKNFRSLNEMIDQWDDGTKSTVDLVNFKKGILDTWGVASQDQESYNNGCEREHDYRIVEVLYGD